MINARQKLGGEVMGVNSGSQESGGQLLCDPEQLLPFFGLFFFFFLFFAA